MSGKSRDRAGIYTDLHRTPGGIYLHRTHLLVMGPLKDIESMWFDSNSPYRKGDMICIFCRPGPQTDLGGRKGHSGQSGLGNSLFGKYHISAG